MATLQSLNINDTGNLTLPSGTRLNRPTTNYTVVRWLTSGATVLTGSATTTSTSWTCPAGVTSIEVLAVAGGGGGGGWGGGGGAGGLVYNNAYPVTPGTVYTVTIGGGGARGTTAYTVGSNGSNTVFGTIRAIGGGGGGAWSNQTPPNGGSGGGGSGVGSFGLGFPGQGTNGGPSPNSTQSSPYLGHGGGGGAGFAGSQGSGVTGGAGGAGLAYSISGTTTWYAGGGGGHSPGAGNAAVASGGIGGGGNGGNYTTPTAATSGTNGLGGGGGGSYGITGQEIGDGGSGVVIIRYALNASSVVPNAQMRHNTTIGTPEIYTANNRWNYANGLVLHLDAADSGSYSGSGSTWSDISGYGNDCVFSSLPTYSATAPSYFTFNGTSNVGTITQTSSLDFSTGQTLIMFLRHSYTSGRRNPWNQAYGGYGTWTHEQGNSMSQYYGTAGRNASPYYGMSSATTNRNVWNMMCAARDASGFKWYVNGVLSFAGRYNDYGVLPDTQADILIGNGYAGYWQGDMSMVMAFNRGLTNIEIQQIYQNYRSRYGN